MTCIAYICADPGVSVFGRKGCTVHVQEVVRAFRAQGAQVVLFATRLGGDPPPDLSDLPVHRLPGLPKGNPAAREQAAFESNAVMASLLERERPFDVVYERYALWSYAGMCYARAQDIPGLLEVNAPLIEEQATHRDLVDRARAEWVAQRSFGAASALVAVSGGVARYLEDYPGAQGCIHIVPNGVRAGRFPKELAPSRPAPPGTYTVGFVGTLKPWHGLPVLIKAFALLHEKVPAARLLLVGDGPERSRLEEELAACGLREAACFTGAVSPEVVPGLLASMDVAVAPYPHLPGFYFSPLKVFEYMAAGLPVVASRIGQLEEVIEGGVSGALCSPGDPRALAAALHALLARPGGAALAAHIAAAADKLHRSGLPSSRRHTMADELAILHERLPRVAERHPQWARRIEHLLEACDRLGAATPEPCLVPIHRDFSRTTCSLAASSCTCSTSTCTAKGTRPSTPVTSSPTSPNRACGTWETPLRCGIGKSLSKKPLWPAPASVYSDDPDHRFRRKAST